MEYLSKTLTEKLIKCQIIKSEDKELYTYGFWQGAVFIFNLITVIVVGLFFNMLWQSLVFMAAYGLLRSMAGGYHARTQKSCYILSLVLIVIVLCVLKWLQWSNIICLVILLISAGVIFLLAPIEDQNKLLDKLEQRVYKKRSRIIVLFLSLIAALFIWIGQINIASCVAVSILAVAIMLILGKVKNMTFQN